MVAGSVDVVATFSAVVADVVVDGVVVAVAVVDAADVAVDTVVAALDIIEAGVVDVLLACTIAVVIAVAAVVFVVAVVAIVDPGLFVVAVAWLSEWLLGSIKSIIITSSLFPSSAEE